MLLLLLASPMFPSHYLWPGSNRSLLSCCLFLSILFTSQFCLCQSPLGAGIFGQLSFPGASSASNYGAAQFPQPRPLPYANTLWPFASSYSSDGGSVGAFYPSSIGQSRQPQIVYPQPLPYYAAQMPISPQQQQQNSLNDLIAELSVALVRSFAQMLAERELSAVAGGGGGQARDGSNGVIGALPFLRGIQSSRDGGTVFGIPFGQPPALQTTAPFGSRTSTNYGYGVNAGVFAGTYGGSDSIAGPFGPYGAMNSQIGGSPYSGLSSYPYIPGQFRRPPVPAPPVSQPSANANNNNTRAAGGSQPTQPNVQSAGALGEGSVVQIPLTENVQTGGGEGSGAGELPIPPEGLIT